MKIKNLTGLIVISILSVAFTSPKSLSLGLEQSNKLIESKQIDLKEEFLIAQSNEVQAAVNAIHQLRQQGRITVGEFETQTFGSIKVSTTGGSTPSTYNLISIGNMQTGRGVIVQAIGDNSYKYIALVINDEPYSCFTSCPVYQAQ